MFLFIIIAIAIAQEENSYLTCDLNQTAIDNNLTLSQLTGNWTFQCEEDNKDLYIDQNTSLGCIDYDCIFTLIVKHSIWLRNGGSINASIIHIEAGENINVDKDSYVTVRGMGNLQGPGSSTYDQAGQPFINGGAFGGQGGGCADSNLATSKAYGGYDMEYVHGDPDTNLTLFKGSGGGYITQPRNETRGGGIISMQANYYNILGLIDASGGEYQPADQNQSSGGSGGYVIIKQPLKSQETCTFSVIKVNGGKGFNNQGGGGSGGRMYLNLAQSLPMIDAPGKVFQFDVSGGDNAAATNQPCLIGAPGTVSLTTPQSNNTMENSLVQIFIIGGTVTSTSCQPLKTPLLRYNQETEGEQLYIYVGNFANLSPVWKDENETESTIKSYNMLLHDSSCLGSPIGNYNSTHRIRVRSTSIELFDNAQIFFEKAQDTVTFEQVLKLNITSQSKLLTSQTVNTYIHLLEQGNLLMDSSSQITAGQNLVIESGTAIIQTITLQQNPSLQQPTFLSLVANDVKIETKISSDTAHIIARNDLEIKLFRDTQIIGPATQNSAFRHRCQDVPKPLTAFFNYTDKTTQNQSEALVLENLSQFYEKDNNSITDVKQLPHHLNQSFSHSFVAINNLHITSQSVIHGPIIGLYGGFMNISGKIKANEFGCQSNEGKGAGSYPTETCGGGGGSHAGSGGLGLKKTNDTKSLRIACRNNTAESMHRSYGSLDDWTVESGSGGGAVSTQTTTDNQYGNGGGIVWIQSGTLLLNDARITADGAASSSDLDQGGGSGGSILITTFQISGQGIVSIKGGDSYQDTTTQQAGNGGGGSGGRFKLRRLDWSNTQGLFDTSKKLTVWRAGGRTGQLENFQATQGSVYDTPCPLGYTGLMCNPCFEGNYSTNILAGACTKCTNMPQGTSVDSAFYSNNITVQTNMDCPYECNTDLPNRAENPLCLDQYNLIIFNIGGSMVFAILIIFTVILVLAALIILWYKGFYKQKLKLRDDQKVRVLQEQNGMKFYDQELYQHLCRIYFIGNNTPKRPFKLSNNPNVILKPRTDMFQYSQFVKEINQMLEWTSCEAWNLWLLSWVYPPFVHIYKFRKRRQKCTMLINHLSQFSTNDTLPFWRHEEDRMMSYIQFRLSFSNELSLAYIDMLDTRMTADQFQGTMFPKTILFSGEGTLNDPFLIDYENDPLVKSVGGRMADQKAWKKYIRNFNTKMLQIQPKTFSMITVQNFLKILDFVDFSNEEFFTMSGIKCSLCIIRINDNSSSRQSEALLSDDITESIFMLDTPYLQKKRTHFLTFINHWRQTLISRSNNDEYKLALVFQNLKDHQVYNQGRLSQLASDYKKNGSNGTNDKHVSQRSFSGRLEFLEDDDIRQNRGSKILVSSEIEGRSQRNKSNNQLDLDNIYSPEKTSQKSSPFMQRRQNIQGDDHLCLITSTIMARNVDQYWLKTFKRRQEEDQEDAKCKCCTSLYHNIYSFFVSCFIQINLSSSPMCMVVSPVLVLNIINAIADVVLTINLIITQTNEIRSLIIYFAFYPFIIIITPFMGLVSLISCKSYLYRYHAYFNAYSMLNTMLILIMSLVENMNKNPFTVQLFLLSFIKLLVQLFISKLLPIQIACAENPKYLANQKYLEEEMQFNVKDNPFKEKKESRLTRTTFDDNELHEDKSSISM